MTPAVKKREGDVVAVLNDTTVGHALVSPRTRAGKHV